MMPRRVSFAIFVSLAFAYLACSRIEDEKDKAENALKFKVGDVFVQKLEAKKNQAITALIEAHPELAAGIESGDLEVLLADQKGKEYVYRRKDGNTLSIAYTPDEDGVYRIVIKINGKALTKLPKIDLSGGRAVSDLSHAINQTDATHGKLLLKGFVALSRNCVQINAAGNADSVAAPSGKYYVQPLIFYGEVGESGTVTEISTATMKIVAGSEEVAIKSLVNLERKMYRDVYASNSSLSDDKERALTRMFYQGYFGAAGELYTVETFRKGGDCAAAQTISLSGDIGAVNLSLVISDSARSLSESIPLRATIQPPFSTYLGDGSKIADWTQCTYDPLTGKPKTYNGDASTCKSFDIASPPSVALDYLMPSKTSEGESAGWTKLSDPTRLIFYGHSKSKEWMDALIASKTQLAAGTMTEVSLDRCYNNGGLIAIPLQEDKATMPLKEFNVESGDIINLARRSGSHTVLTGFYQGNISVAGTYSLPTCIPSDTESCVAYKTLSVKIKDCTIKADSGISVGSIADSYIYPDYFEMSGMIE